MGADAVSPEAPKGAGAAWPPDAPEMGTGWRRALVETAGDGAGGEAGWSRALVETTVQLQT